MYPIAPAPAMTDPNIRICAPFLTPEQVTGIRQLGDDYLERLGKPGEVGFHEGQRVDRTVRSCQSVWLPWPDKEPRVRELYDMLGQVAQEANAHFWQYDVWGFQDNLHYVRYDAADDGHFSWHQDRGDDWRRLQRKLAVILQLSAPGAEYEGGEFQIFDGREQTIRHRDQGVAYVFPSFIQHRALPVTKGSGRILIGWLGGPKFR